MDRDIAGFTTYKRHVIASQVSVKYFLFLFHFFSSLTIIGIDRDIAAATTTRSLPLHGSSCFKSQLSFFFSYFFFFH